MLDLNKIVSGLSKSGAASGLAGGLAGGAVVGALASKKGRKTAAKVARIGGLALVGGLAWKAYDNYRNTRGTTAIERSDREWDNHGEGDRPRSPAARNPALASPDAWEHLRRQDFEAVASEPAGPESRSLLIVRAMIAAAMADGHLDAAEQGRLFREIDRLELSTEEKGMLVDELRHPLPVRELVASCPDPETAIEVYAASVLAIDETREESKPYLATLARRLNLPETLVESIHYRSSQQKNGFALAEPA